MKTVPLPATPMKNGSPAEFRARLLQLPFLGYELTQFRDGRKLCVSTPNFKSPQIWIYDAATGRCENFTHWYLYGSVKLRRSINPEQSRRLEDAFSRVLAGEAPDTVLASMPNLDDGYVNVFRSEFPGPRAETLLHLCQLIGKVAPQSEHVQELSSTTFASTYTLREKEFHPPASYSGHFLTVPIPAIGMSRLPSAGELRNLPILAYHAEALAEGTEICIVRPGTLGGMKGITHDSVIFLNDPATGQCCLPEYESVLRELRQWRAEDPEAGPEIVAALQCIADGDEPEDVLDAYPHLHTQRGRLVDFLLKWCKWYFGVEDSKYPIHEGYKGREMFMQRVKKALID